jgi:hypothetical protein
VQQLTDPTALLLCERGTGSECALDSVGDLRFSEVAAGDLLALGIAEPYGGSDVTDGLVRGKWLGSSHERSPQVLSAERARLEVPRRGPPDKHPSVSGV